MGEVYSSSAVFGEEVFLVLQCGVMVKVLWSSWSEASKKNHLVWRGGGGAQALSGVEWLALFKAAWALKAAWEADPCLPSQVMQESLQSSGELLYSEKSGGERTK